MRKKLTAKIQQLNPTLPQYSGTFSKCITIEPDTKEVLLKKGAVYAVFEIQGDASFDTELITKVTNDVIHNSYYQSDNISPIQSMEKTILEARDKIIQLSSDVLRSDQQPIRFNIMASVLWGNVLYVVQYGDMKCFIMEEGNIKPLSMVSEGNFSAASQVVNNNDVIIICTEDFEKELPPEKLLSSSVADQSLKPSQSCLLMKMVVDTNFTEDEVVDFGLEKAISKAKSKAVSKKGLNVLTGVGAFFRKTTGKIFKSNVISKIPHIKLPKIKAVSAVNSLTGESKFVFKTWMIAPFVLVILLMIVIPKFLTKKGASNEQITQPESTQLADTAAQENAQKEAEDKKALEEAQILNDTTYLVTRINPEVFYDIKITDPQIEPTEIAAFTDKLVAVEKSSGKIFISDTKTPKFTAQADTYPGIRSISNYEGKLNFLDDSGYKIFNIESLAVSEQQSISGDIAFPYSGYIYTELDGVIKKYKDTKTEAVVWGELPSFKNAKSMAIAFNIYIITADNKLESYSSGKKTDFLAFGLENGFADAVKVIADVDLKNIYVADRGNKSVVILTNKGELIKQYKTEKDETWEDIRSIAVSPDEKTLYVLSGSKVFQVNL